MEDHVRHFKAIAAQVADRHGFSFGACLTDHGLRDFLIEVAAGGDSPADMAAKALVWFCVEEGRFNGFLVGLETVLQFLAEQLGGPQNSTERVAAFKDLRSILESRPDFAAVRQWVAAHYE